MFIIDYILPFLFVLTLVIFFHELGHFSVARWCGVQVESFSIGFGRALASWRDKRGTLWKIGWLPLGGYVKFLGDENAASLPTGKSSNPHHNDARSFPGKPLWQKTLIVAAGPCANFLLAIVIFAVIFFSFGRQIMLPVVGEVQPDSPAATAGLRTGDVIEAINGQEMTGFRMVQQVVSVHAGQTLRLDVLRDGTLVRLVAIPQARTVTDRFGNSQKRGILGIKSSGDSANTQAITYGPLTALWQGVVETWNILSNTMAYLWDIILGRAAGDQLGGPLRIAKMSGDIAATGLLPLITFTAILSVSIGLINLFPVPLLDGGHLLYYAVEAVRRKPVSARAQEVGFRVGLGLVLALMIFVTWNDLLLFDIPGRLANVFN